MTTSIAHGGHHRHDDGGGLVEALAYAPTAGVVLVTVGYLVLAARRRREPPGWSARRTASFVAGTALLALALTPGAHPLPAGDLRTHMAQHLLIGMYAPLGIMLGAPMTLLLRSLPRPQARRLGRALGSRALGVAAHPAVGLLLTVGGLGVLYLTPLLTLTERSATAHHLVHLHFLLAGCLFTHAIAGPDPAPHRPGVPTRLVVLGAAIVGHGTISQLLYAGLLVQVAAPLHERTGAATLMYYGGDIAELLLALAMVATWRPARPTPPLRDAAGRRAPRPRRRRPSPIP